MLTGLDWHRVAAVAWPLLAALVLGLVVRRALLAIARRARAHAATGVRARIAQVIAVPAAVALPLLFLSVAVGSTPLRPLWAMRIQHALAVGGLLCLTWLAVRAVGAVATRILRDHPVDVADNLDARRVQTQTRVLARVAQGGIGLVGLSLALMTFPAIRQLGTTLLASAGVIGLVAGIAARPVLGNLIAGLQIALSQPIRLDDVIIVEGEWGRVEEITGTYVVVRVWDERRLVVPLQWFIEHPFQNWTRTTAQLLGTVSLWLDYRTPMAAVRDELQRICQADARWDGRVCLAQVTEADPSTIQVRVLVSAANSGDLFDLRCVVRERLVEFLVATHPEALPRTRADVVGTSTIDRIGAGNGAHVADQQGDGANTAAAADQVAATTSPGAEDVTAADIAAAQQRDRAG